MILSTSAEKRFKNTILCYSLATIFCILFTNIYAIFGHGVSSLYMSYMFLYPLIGGVVLFLVLYAGRKSLHKKSYHRASYNLYNSGVVCFTVGSMLQGIFEIAGTNSGYILVYYIAGGTLILVSIVCFLLENKKSGKNNYKESVQA